MGSWFWYALVAALLYGAHQIFTRLAADRIGQGLGGFIVEATGALSMLFYSPFFGTERGARDRETPRFPATGKANHLPGSAPGSLSLRVASDNLAR